MNLEFECPCTKVFELTKLTQTSISSQSQGFIERAEILLAVVKFQLFWISLAFFGQKCAFAT